MKKTKNRTDGHPLISCGTREKALLKHIINSKGLINISGYARTVKVTRGRIYETLTALRYKGLISYDAPSRCVTTDKGNRFFETVRRDRRGCTGVEDEKSIIRDHKFTFEVRVYEFPNNWKNGKVAYFDKETTQTTIHNFSKNNDRIFLEFPDDVGLTITTTKVIIKPRNIFGHDHTVTTEKAIIKAYEILTLLREKGFKITDSKNTVNLIQTEGHYAEVKSILGQLFEKHFKNFCITDENKKKLFYLDYSNGVLEDETEDELSRLRIERHMKDIMKNDLPKISELASDIENLKEITASLVKLQLIKNSVNIPKEIEGFDKIDYIG